MPQTEWKSRRRYAGHHLSSSTGYAGWLRHRVSRSDDQTLDLYLVASYETHGAAEAPVATLAVFDRLVHSRREMVAENVRNHERCREHAVERFL